MSHWCNKLRGKSPLLVTDLDYVLDPTEKLRNRSQTVAIDQGKGKGTEKDKESKK